MTDTPPRDDPPCDHEWPPMGDLTPNAVACVKCGHFEMVVPPTRVVIQPVRRPGWWEFRFDRPVPFESESALTPEQTVVLVAPERHGWLPLTGVWHTDEDGDRVDLRRTELRWGEGVTSDATRTDREVGIPVCDDDGRELGEMRMSYANAGVLGAMLTDAARDANPVHGWVKAQLGDLPEWQKRWLDHLMQMRSREQRRTRYEANSAYQRGMRLAQGHDVPPLPVPVLPTRVDDLDSDTYDALRSRYAYLESRYRDTAHSELAAINVRQAMEIGDRGEALDRVRQLHHREPLYVLDCDCPRPDEGTDAYDDYEDYEDSHTVTADGDTVCLKQPRGAECGHCRNSDGDNVLWPCPTVRALDETPPDMPLTCGDCGHPVTHANYRCGTKGCPNGSVDLTITPTSTALDDTPEQP